MRRRAVYVIATIAVVALLSVVFLYNPMDSAFPYPRCLFKVLTGWDCPGCGSTRALHALLHGRIADAWSANPAIFAAVPLIGLCFAAESPRFQRLRRVIFSSRFVVALLAATLLWTLFRNLY